MNMWETVAANQTKTNIERWQLTIDCHLRPPVAMALPT